MDLAATSLYCCHAVAPSVWDGPEPPGIDRQRIPVLPSVRIVPSDADSSGSATTRDNAEDALRRLQDLHLPESDARTCRQALRNGACVVSAGVGDEAGLDRVQEVMDRPGETSDPDDLNLSCIGAAVVPAAGWRHR